MKDLKDRVALVPGGNRGIGAAVAIALAGARADVAVNCRERADAARAVCSEIKKTGRKAIAVQADVSVAAHVERMVTDVEAQLGGVDILVNNAAIANPRQTAGDHRGGMERSAGSQSRVGVLRDAGGSEECGKENGDASSTYPRLPRKRVGRRGAHYAASKAGIIGRTHSCGSAFIREGITVNAIAPALVETDMVTNNPNANPNLIPMGHFDSVDDVASVAVMLAMNDYMTGQTISVNGGWYMS